MKKLTAIIVALVMALSLFALASCGNETSECKHLNTKETVTSATCTSDGTVIVKCNDCKKVIKKETTPKLGHNYVAGFCARKGCADPIEKENNKFYVNLLCSLIDSEKYSFANQGDVKIKNGENVSVYDSVKFLRGKSSGENPDELFSFTASGANNVELRAVSDSENLKLTGTVGGEEKLYVRANGEAVKKLYDKYKDEIIKNIGGSGSSEGSESSGSSGSFGGSGISGESIISSLETLFDEIKTKDGTGATVKRLNTGIHSVITSVAKIDKTESGFDITPDAEKVKEFNHVVATQPFEAFVDNILGKDTFEAIKSVIQMAINRNDSLTDAEKTAKYDEFIADCGKLSLYKLIEKYDDSEDEVTIEEDINSFVDSLKGVKITLRTDEKGNALSVDFVAEDFELIGEITIPGITIGGVTSEPIVINGLYLTGNFTLSFLNERIEAEEYAPFEKVVAATDTKLAAGNHEGYVKNNGNCTKVVFATDAKGNIVSATSYFTLNQNAETGFEQANGHNRLKKLNSKFKVEIST